MPDSSDFDTQDSAAAMSQGTTEMNGSTDQWSQNIENLAEALSTLEATASPLQLAPLSEREWYELLVRKLIPQLGANPFLIVSVVGGTNIGKSVIFNHLAGERISSTSPLASGTKHPTALLPESLNQHIHLGDLFPGFQIETWKDAQQPLQPDSQHHLFYRLSHRMPENLIILDTPDIDSVEEVNWERADDLRLSSDVLIAVLTQQKYNDAAVKEFFRKAAQEGKLVLIVFNQCLLPEDEAYWPLWVKTFCDETGTRPHLLYLAPNDRRAAESNQLPFYERAWPPVQETSPADDARPRQLLHDLSQLKFDEIKTHALYGALQHLVSPELGIPAWLKEISSRGQEFHEALQLFTQGQLVEIDRWPTLPNSLLIEQVRQWWREQRNGWSANVHGFYHKVGQMMTVPFKMVAQRGKPAADSPLERYRKLEWEAILDAVERCLQKLVWLKDLGNPLLSPRLQHILSGSARTRLIDNLRQAHAQLDFQAEVRDLVALQLQQFQKERPETYQLFRRMDSMAAAARPAVSLVLFMTGAGPLGNAMTPMVTETALQGALHIAGETVGGTVVTAVGDKVITEAASGGAGYLETRFRQLHAAFARQRADWMIGQLNQHLLRSFSQDLNTAATIAHSADYLRVSRLAEELQRLLMAAEKERPN